MTGKTLGHYQVTDKLGAGGMGEVYRARDTRLGRDVALKFLPAALAGDSNSLARFEREAQLLAQLNHANIAAIHGLEEAEGQRFLVLEYVPGKNLQGPLPIEEAEAVARQIIDALEDAHERGIMHRDLKPANIKITPDGKVKVLDFGLAKAMLGDPVDEIASNSPTLAATALTRGAVLLGTAAYMSPEQARGRRVDKRTDIFAFGSVLYELLTGKQAFGGETISDSLAAILTKEPDRSLLPAAISSNLRSLLDRCLEKDPKRRLRDIGEARILLDAAPLEIPRPPTPGPQPPPRQRLLPWAVAPLAAIVAGLAVWLLTRPPKPLPRPVLRVSTPVSLPNTLTPSIALSRDGTKLAYSVGQRTSQSQIHLRALDQLEPRPLAGAQGAGAVFSPDGQWLAFSEGLSAPKLKKVQVVGGAVITLCDGATYYGGDWGRDGNIIFGAFAAGLSRVSAAGGKPEVLTTPNPKKGEGAHRWPHVLPGGGAVLFTVGAASGSAFGAGNYDDAKIVVLSLQTREQRVLIEGGTSARYVPGAAGGTGYLVYYRAGALFAVPFDLKRLAVTGSPVSVLEGVSGLQGSGLAEFSFSDGGTLVYLPGGSAEGANATLVWVDRQGKEQALAAPPRPYRVLRLSPDGQRVAATIGSSTQSDIWVHDIPRGGLTRITFQGDNNFPVWSPDGKRVAFVSAEGAKTSIAWAAADGTGSAEALAAVEGGPVLQSWSPDGKVLLFARSDPKGGGRDTWLLPLDGDRKPRRWLETPYGKTQPRLSPDGRWISYNTGGRGGRPEVYVQPFAASGASSGTGGRWQVSVDGGAVPRWSRDGRELFYMSGNKVMSVPLEPGGAPSGPFKFGTPRLLFESRHGAGPFNLEVSADGKRFLFIKTGEPDSAAGQQQLHFVVEWFEEVRRRVAAGAAQ